MTAIRWVSGALGAPAWFCCHCGATGGGERIATSKSAREHKCLVGTVVTTIHGNKLRLFDDGWSPLKDGNWDRWTVYTDAELAANFALAKTT